MATKEVRGMPLFLTTWCLVFGLGLVVGLMVTEGRGLALRHLLGILIVALGIAIAVPSYDNAPDSLKALGVAIIAAEIGLWSYFEEHHRNRKRQKPEDDTPGIDTKD